ncbi:MAG TPA: AAA family ATPase, partial [Candidatus Tectomicrobia bacterium]
FETAGHETRKWTFILGENGTGKSSILRAIALLVAGSEALPELLVRPDTWIRLGQAECAIEADLVTAEGEERHIALRWARGQHIRTIFEQNKETMDRLDAALRHTNRNYFTIGYGVSRRFADNRSVNTFREVYAHPRAQGVATLFSNDAVLNPLDTWAMDMEYRRSQAGLDIVRKALANLLPGVTLSRIDRENRELLFATPDGELPLSQLSDGYQNMAAWCGDLVYRIVTTYADYEQPLSARGLLLIDEIDLHLHPVWQRVLKNFLDRKLPNFQILGTTHSPLTAQQAGEEELYFLRRAGETGPARLEAYTGAPNKLLTHQVLLSPVFGLPSMNSKEVEDLKGEYRSLQAAEGSLSRAQKTRLNRLRDALSDIPDWTRETEHDRRQTELLAKIQETLERRPASGNGRGGRRKGRA